MPDTTLVAEPRTTLGSRPSGRLRREGKVPAVVYGLGTDTVSVTVPARELQHILAGESGANTLITLDVDGESVLTLARQIHRHPTGDPGARRLHPHRPRRRGERRDPDPPGRARRPA